MKGVILAGGLGTRLRPLTLVTNKHLLPVYNKPMIMYPLETLKQSGITDIMIVTGREHAGHFMQFLGSGKEHGVTLRYALQDTDNGGIADALSYAEDFAEGGPVAIILGDNIFEYDFKKPVSKFEKGAMAFFKPVPDPRRFGVPVFSKDKKRVMKIEEKPKKPKSDCAQVGFYIVDGRAFEFIRTLAPSARGEREMTDLINIYISSDELAFDFVKGHWLDAGTIESLHSAAAFVRRKSTKKK